MSKIQQAFIVLWLVPVLVSCSGSDPSRELAVEMMRDVAEEADDELAVEIIRSYYEIPPEYSLVGSEIMDSAILPDHSAGVLVIDRTFQADEFKRTLHLRERAYWDVDDFAPTPMSATLHYYSGRRLDSEKTWERFRETRLQDGETPNSTGTK